MASSLELGKLVTASFLYRYWKSVNIAMRVYLTTAVITLVFITSLGIYGYLTNAYQKASIELNKQLNQMNFIEERIEDLNNDQEFLLKEMEEAINSYPDNYITAKRQVREQYTPLIQKQSQEILDLKSDLSNINLALIDTGIEVGPAIFISKLTDLPIDLIVNILILILVFVFDPLAVMLVVAYNKLILENYRGDKQ
tara:strand:- start:848 stop:1438 length:591 start_codon:yes stop_codon:yes gene_type:complete